MAIHVNLGDTGAVEALCKMLNSGVKGRDVNIDVRTINGQVISTPHEEKEWSDKPTGIREAEKEEE